MAIRFRCSACSQPIEIDDEWASKTVACPYCRKTVTAPAESLLEDLSRVPMATAALDETTVPGPTTVHIPAVSGTNRVALVALILGFGSIFLMVAAYAILAQHSDEVSEFYKSVKGAATLNEQMSRQSEFLKTHPGAERWLLSASALLIGSAVASLAAVVCGIVGLRRRTRRRLAVAALVTAGLVPVFLCSGALSG